MKKLLSIVALISVLYSATVFAAPATSYGTAAKEPGYITVNANESTEIEPNLAKISFTVQTEGKDINKVSTDIDELANKLSAMLKEKMAETDTIKTSTYNVSPQYVYKDKKRVLVGYIGTTKMSISTSDINNLSSLISLAMSNGATAVGELEFISTGYNDTCNNLIQKATAEALTQAKETAEAAKTTLNGIKYINASCGVQSAYPRYAMMKTAGSNADEAASVNSKPNLEPGTIKLNADVSASFYVK